MATGKIWESFLEMIMEPLESLSSPMEKGQREERGQGRELPWAGFSRKQISRQGFACRRFA
jgi:hypothetical protein